IVSVVFIVVKSVAFSVEDDGCDVNCSTVFEDNVFVCNGELLDINSSILFLPACLLVVFMSETPELCIVSVVFIVVNSVAFCVEGDGAVEWLIAWCFDVLVIAISVAIVLVFVIFVKPSSLPSVAVFPVFFVEALLGVIS
ncbi:unnamed protein product, partial [Haemonchus placei]|uniref:Product n=1 Tax=Haemonchus placei TaxID=6290 RepID=A0A0N4VSD9_HAEPC